jgi:hypothetical protein
MRSVTPTEALARAKRGSCQTTECGRGSASGVRTLWGTAQVARPSPREAKT